MNESKNSKPYDLEERTLRFAQETIKFINTISKTVANLELVKQLIRASSSIGANYIEANEALSKKDFSMRVKICRKEAKETIFWLRLLEIKQDDIEKKRQSLITEATELMKIFGAIIEKTK